MDTKRVRSDEARRTFRAILNEVEHQGAHVMILRYETPAAVLVPVHWYEAAKAAAGAADVQPGGRDEG